jgi:hypothetical protein
MWSTTLTPLWLYGERTFQALFAVLAICSAVSSAMLIAYLWHEDDRRARKLARQQRREELLAEEAETSLDRAAPLTDNITQAPPFRAALLYACYGFARVIPLAGSARAEPSK